jgi:hypothetical protein
MSRSQPPEEDDMTTPHPEQPAEGADDVPADSPGDDDQDPETAVHHESDADADDHFIVEQPGALEV